MFLRKIVVSFAAFVVIALAGTIFAFPAVAALACPACYGFDRLDSNIFVERGMPAEHRARVTNMLTEAHQRVTTFYGSFNSHPRILVCSTETCYSHIGGGRQRGVSFFDVALLLSPRGLDVVIASHELSHIELHHCLGLLRSLTNAIPAWFDEGVAVIVSDDRRYLAPVGLPDRCLIKSDEPLPSGMSEWNRHAGEHDSHIYAEAACRVNEWMSKRGGSEAITNLILMVSSGTPFSQVYQ